MADATRHALLSDLASRIAILDVGHAVRVGVDGVDAAGKTHFADALVEPLRAYGRPVVRASIDGFHRPRAERYRLGRHSPEGYFCDSFDLARLLACLLQPLGPGGSHRITRATFDYRTDSSVEMPEEVAGRDAILVFDGVFLHRPELLPYWDATVYLDVPFEITVRRAARRDGWPPAVDAPENRRYVEGQRLYLRECNPAAVASAVIDNADVDRPVVKALRPPLDGRTPAVTSLRASLLRLRGQSAP